MASTREGAVQRSRRMVWAGIAVVVLVLMALAQSDVGYRTLRETGLAPADAAYTELFFDPSGDLPTALPGGSRESFAIPFVVGNGTPGATTVDWRLLVVDGTSRPALATGRVDLAPFERRSQTATVPVTCSGPQVAVEVSVSSQADPIRQLVTCTPPRPAPPAVVRGR